MPIINQTRDMSVKNKPFASKVHPYLSWERCNLFKESIISKNFLQGTAFLLNQGNVTNWAECQFCRYKNLVILLQVERAFMWRISGYLIPGSYLIWKKEKNLTKRKVVLCFQAICISTTRSFSLQCGLECPHCIWLIWGQNSEIQGQRLLIKFTNSLSDV